MSSSYIYADRPQRIYWEVTRACDLACRHCRAEASPDAAPDQLTAAEAETLLDNLARFGAPLPHLVLTGGDALKRADLFTLIASAQARGFAVSVAPSATPLLNDAAIAALKGAGVDAISLSLDGSTAERHDAIRGIPGTFARTLDAAAAASRVGLPFQVNTLVCESTVDDLEAIYDHVRTLGAARWSLFFLITVGRGEVLSSIEPQRADAVLNWAVGLNGRPDSGGVVVTTTEAPHVRRIASQKRRGHPGAAAGGRPPAHANHAAGIRDGNGILFISHVGDICPSGFLEITAGNVRVDDVVAVYRGSTLFTQLREPEAFQGRCGQCEFHFVCGGSRARAYAVSGSVVGEDPLCDYQPHSQGSGTRDQGSAQSVA